MAKTLKRKIRKTKSRKISKGIKRSYRKKGGENFNTNDYDIIPFEKGIRKDDIIMDIDNNREYITIINVSNSDSDDKEIQINKNYLENLNKELKETKQKGLPNEIIEKTQHIEILKKVFANNVNSMINIEHNKYHYKKDDNSKFNVPDETGYLTYDYLKEKTSKNEYIIFRKK